MKYFKFVSLGLGIYFLGSLLYQAKDIMECDPTPLGLWGVVRVMLALIFIWGLGYLSGRQDLEN